MHHTKDPQFDFAYKTFNEAGYSAIVSLTIQIYRYVTANIKEKSKRNDKRRDKDDTAFQQP